MQYLLAFSCSVRLRRSLSDFQKEFMGAVLGLALLIFFRGEELLSNLLYAHEVRVRCASIAVIRWLGSQISIR